MGKTLRIVKNIVIDNRGNVVGDDPRKFSTITNRCKEVSAYLETGKLHKVV
ncbi:hypothetical protein [Paenibacillus bouchesdurhonensis]|uniref:hypothetical protein n=1 Tax=Paenibacillus bouchesdurhonensis TaxID=1870990 RepID=UPI0018FF215C|nr:hypothetical protein [Paenibacillus bouchesdurhonensis]